MTWTRDAATSLRAEWLTVMDDTCTIRTNTQGQGTYSKITRTYDATPSVVYTGQCLVRERGHSSADYGEAQQELVEYDLYLPGTVTGLVPDLQVTVDSINSDLVPTDLQGQVLTVLEVGLDTWNARIRLGCKLSRGAG